MTAYKGMCARCGGWGGRGGAFSAYPPGFHVPDWAKDEESKFPAHVVPIFIRQPPQDHLCPSCNTAIYRAQCVQCSPLLSFDNPPSVQCAGEGPASTEHTQSQSERIVIHPSYFSANK
jgi:hypothetical protein